MARWGDLPLFTLEQIDNNLLVETAAWIAFRAVGWLHADRLAQMARIDNFLDRRLDLDVTL